MDTYRIAHIAHEVNRAYCVSLGDNSQPTWENAPDWQIASAVDGVQFLASNPDATPERSHANWLAHKQRDGWRCGPVKDPAKKEHPCMVPYDQLPPSQRLKDHLFHAVVRAALAEKEEK